MNPLRFGSDRIAQKASDIEDISVVFGVAFLQHTMREQNWANGVESPWVGVWMFSELFPTVLAKVKVAKLYQMIRAAKPLIQGCDCSSPASYCRMDLELTEAGADYLVEHGEDWLRGIEAQSV